MSRKNTLESKLTPKQREAALLLVERDLSDTDSKKSLDEVAEELGMSVRGLYNWRTQNKDFIDYVNLIADDFLESKRSTVYRQLMKLIEGSQPSVKALDLYLRRHGLLTDKQVVETKELGGSTNAADIQRELAELDELLSDDIDK